jgi:hypothetical protein
MEVENTSDDSFQDVLSQLGEVLSIPLTQETRLSLGGKCISFMLLLTPEELVVRAKNDLVQAIELFYGSTEALQARIRGEGSAKPPGTLTNQKLPLVSVLEESSYALIEVPFDEVRVLTALPHLCRTKQWESFCNCARNVYQTNLFT